MRVKIRTTGPSMIPNNPRILSQNSQKIFHTLRTCSLECYPKELRQPVIHFITPINLTLNCSIPACYPHLEFQFVRAESNGWDVTVFIPELLHPAPARIRIHRLLYIYIYIYRMTC